MSENMTLESAQAQIAELKAKLAKKNKQPAPVTYRIGLESGELEVHHLTPNMISLPTEVWKGLLAQAPKLIDFMFANNHLLAVPSDDTETQEGKRAYRQKVYDENPGKNNIVRPKRKEKTEEAETASEPAATEIVEETVAS